MKSNWSAKTVSWNGWILVPLRLFLGVTFVYAGMQKLTDPQYFNPAAHGYVGRQIAAFATGSPLHEFLMNVTVPHAVLFGGLAAYGELAIGLGVLSGLALRIASLFGFLINLTFFLSADWHVFPYFYGSDIVFLFCWLTLLIAGPANQSLPASDTWLVRWLVKHAEPARQARRAAICAWVFGVRIDPAPDLLSRQDEQLSKRMPKQQPDSQYRTWQLEQAQQQSRRNFVWGTLTGGVAMLTLAWLAETLHLLPDRSSSESDLSPDQEEVTPTLGSPVTSDTPTSTLPDGVIAQIGSVPANSSVNFTLPSNGDPGILIHLNNGQFVAYDATCTHAGCPVDYDPSSQQLICPCHGAAFDPSKAAAVLNGPAQTPLASVQISVNRSAGTISLSR